MPGVAPLGGERQGGRLEGANRAGQRGRQGVECAVMRRVRGVHLLFGFTLLSLAALGGWWLVFFFRSVELERSARLAELTHVSLVTAMIMGQQPEPPEPGVLDRAAPLEVVPAEARRPGDLFAPALPLHPEWGVRPRAVALAAVEEQLADRRLMFIGEGSLLFVLLGICTAMLYRLVRLERRQLDAMQAFVAAVTHEMKTPLAGLKSMLQTFAAGAVPEAERGRLFALGLKETERLEHMVENVLISGRLRTDRYPLRPEPTALRPLVERFVEHRRRSHLERPDSMELIWQPAGELTVRCDAAALQVVLENLTDNAFKYGGDDPRVRLRVERAAGRVRLAVEDDGIGFEPQRAEDLFGPFERRLDGPAAAQHGSGLGLTISRALVRRMGGELVAHSEGPGRGSRFVVQLQEVAV